MDNRTLGELVRARRTETAPALSPAPPAPIPEENKELGEVYFKAVLRRQKAWWREVNKFRGTILFNEYSL
jgi:hypothetical protein